ncbi:hypothetical protein MPR_1902 [Myroides profundi]|nr:hypothetical protein MPR_1902 [Myroides profundi]
MLRYYALFECYVFKEFKRNNPKVIFDLYKFIGILLLLSYCFT